MPLSPLKSSSRGAKKPEVVSQVVVGIQLASPATDTLYTNKSQIRNDAIQIPESLLFETLRLNAD